jgi:hypothetical protein
MQIIRCRRALVRQKLREARIESGGEAHLEWTMRIFHHISIGGRNISALEDFCRIGIDLKKYGDPPPRERPSEWPVYCEMPEDDPRWGNVGTLLHEYASSEHRIWHRTWTEFTQQERDAAKSLSVGPCWTRGYPEPSDVAAVPGTRYLPYFAATYDLRTYCEVCLAGARQNASFRMKAEPVWGRRSILQLNWVPDELFVKTEVYDAIFRPFGIENQPVLRHKTGAKLDSVVQLSIPQEVTLDVAASRHTTCVRCGRDKYAPVCRGFFPSPLDVVSSMSKSREYFGVTETAFKAILVASPIYEKIRDAGLKGVEFQPCGR